MQPNSSGLFHQSPAETDSDIKDRFTLAKGEGGGEGMGWEADIANANGYIQNG